MYYAWGGGGKAELLALPAIYEEDDDYYYRDIWEGIISLVTKTTRPTNNTSKIASRILALFYGISWINSNEKSRCWDYVIHEAVWLYGNVI